LTTNAIERMDKEKIIGKFGGDYIADEYSSYIMGIDIRFYRSFS